MIKKKSDLIIQDSSTIHLGDFDFYQSNILTFRQIWLYSTLVTGQYEQEEWLQPPKTFNVHYLPYCGNLTIDLRQTWKIVCLF